MQLDLPQSKHHCSFPPVLVCFCLNCTFPIVQDHHGLSAPCSQLTISNAISPTITSLPRSPLPPQDQGSPDPHFFPFIPFRLIISAQAACLLFTPLDRLVHKTKRTHYLGLCLHISTQQSDSIYVLDFFAAYSRMKAQLKAVYNNYNIFPL